MNGRKAALAAKNQIDLPVVHHTEIFEGVCVGELCAIKGKGRQKATRPGVEAHHLILLGVYCQGLLLGVNSQFVKHSL